MTDDNIDNTALTFIILTKRHLHYEGTQFMQWIITKQNCIAMRVTQTFTLYEAKYKKLGAFLDIKKILKKKEK